MSKKIPSVMLMWVHTGDTVVHVETVQREVRVGDRLWSDKLDRFGKVESDMGTHFNVRVE